MKVYRYDDGPAKKSCGITVRLTPGELALIDEEARQLGLSRNGYVRHALLDMDRPIDDRELLQLLAWKAREGGMRAIEMLARYQLKRGGGTAAPVADEPVKVDPFAEFDELAQRRAAG